MNRAGLTLLLVLSVATSGCWFGRRKAPKVPVPVTPAPKAAPGPSSKPIEPPPELPPSNSVPTPAETPVTPSGQTPAEAPPPKPVRKPAARKPARKTAPVPVPAVTAPPATSAPAAQVPQLGVLLTAEQRNQYEAEYSRDMASAMDGLVHILESALSPAQKESMNRVRSFMRQAEDAHARDLAAAAQLARRAAVLAQDLAQSQR